MTRRGFRPLTTIGLSLGAVATVASFAVTSQVAFAYPTPTKHHEIHCDPGNVDAQGGSCSITFKDQDAKGNPRVGQTICFSTDGPGTITPSCSMTDSKGVARSTFYAGAYPGDCSSAGKDGHVKFNIYGQETSDPSDPAGAAATKVQIQCPHAKGGDGGGHDHSGPPPPHGPGGPSHGPNAHNASAILDPASPGGAPTWMLGGAILAIAALLAVAVTGRLRLRRFRA